MRGRSRGQDPPRMGSGLFLWPVQPDKIAWAQLIERCGREMDIEPQGSSRGQDPPRMGSGLFLWPVQPDKIAWAQLIERCGREMDIEPQGSSRGQDPPRIGSVLFLWPVLPAIKKDPDLRRGQDIRSGGGGISLSAVSIPRIAAPRKAQMFPHDAHFRLQTARKHGIL